MIRKALMRNLGIVLVVCAVLSPSAEGTIIPPTIESVSPAGAKRGSTVTLTIEGRSLTGAGAVLFDAPGIRGKVLIVTDIPVKEAPMKGSTAAPIPRASRQEAKLEVTIAPDVEPGIHEFRIQTPLGTSNTEVFDVGSLPEIPEVEPNDTFETSQRVKLPATIVGTIATPGDVDTFQFDGRAGEEMVFQVVAAPLRSGLRPVLILRDATGKALAKSGYSSRRADAVLTYKLPADGKYAIELTDFERGGGRNRFYRLTAGALPYIAEVFPLGVRAGDSVEVAVKGFNLGGVDRVKVQAPPSAEAEIPVEVKSKQGEPSNKVMLAVGSVPEIMEREPNNSPTEAQPITIPVTINGHISNDKRPGLADEDYFRFSARKGQHLTIEVEASRLGSPLDSVIEVLDDQGHEIPRATIRCVAETSMTLADRDSKAKSWRLLSTNEVRENDYLMAGEELVQIEFIPDQPDADTVLKGIGGERVSYLDTSPQVHPVNQAVYKAQILGAGVDTPPNGLPVFHLTYRNDDGGPGYGRDSHLDFVAPRDGVYLLHIKDIRGLEGEDFAYRLTMRDARPDFSLTASPANPNVPRGGRLPVQVTANRRQGYEGPIQIRVKGLPNGIIASAAAIPASQDSATIIFEGSKDAPDWVAATPFQIEGRAKVDGRDVVRVADPDQPLRVASLMPPPDLFVAAETKEVVLEPGKATTVSFHVDRKNDFKGRVPCNVMGLPPGVRVDNVGLNGVLVPEDQTSRTFTLRAEAWAQPTEQPIYVVGTVESNASTRHASGPIALKVAQKQAADVTPQKASGTPAENAATRR